MEALQAIFGILLLVGFFVGIIYIRHLMFKGLHKVTRAVCQNVVLKDKYQKGNQIISQPLIFRTSLSISDIMRNLMAHVTTVETPLGFRWGVYQVSCDEQGVVYAYGNHLNPQAFAAKITFSNNGTETEGIFKVTNWKEDRTMGMIIGQEAIDKLYREVQMAFAAIDASNKNDGKYENMHCGNCGIENPISAKFCKGCGTNIIETGDHDKTG